MRRSFAIIVVLAVIAQPFASAATTVQFATVEIAGVMSAYGVAAGPGDAIWGTGAGFAGGQVVRIDAVTGESTGEVTISDGGPLGITVGTDGDPWVGVETSTDVEIVRIDGTSLAVKGTLPIPGGRGAPAGAATGLDGNIWVALQGPGGSVVRVDPDLGAFGQIVATIPGGIPGEIAVGLDGMIWVTDEIMPTVQRIDPSDNASQSFPVPLSGSGLTVGLDGDLWMSAGTPTTAMVYRLRPVGSAFTVVATVPVSIPAPAAMTTGLDGDVWVVNQDGNAANPVIRISPDGGPDGLGGVVGQVVTSDGSTADGAATATNGSIWVSSFDGATILGIEVSTDLTASMAPDPPAATVGEDLVVAVGLTTTDTDNAAVGVDLQIEVPGGLSVISVPAGCSVGGSTIGCAFAVVGPGSSSMPFVLRGESLGSQVLELSATWSNPETTGSATAAATVDVTAAPVPPAPVAPAIPAAPSFTG